MIAKQTKGRGFRGTLRYVLGKQGAEIIGGNMLGQDSDSLAAEFAESRRLQPKLWRAVYHASLSLPPGETLTDELWRDVADRYVEGMGFKGSQYVAVKHNDTNHSHMHIVASRIRMNGSVVSESHDYRRSETLVRGIEKEFGLTPVSPSRNAEARAPTSGELQKALREERPSVRLKLQNIAGQTSQRCSTMSEFVTQLDLKGVEVIPNIAKTGRITGISYRLDGEMMKGSDLGRGFTWQGLQKRGVKYEQERDLQRLRQAADRARSIGGGSTSDRAAQRQSRDLAPTGRRSQSLGQDTIEAHGGRDHSDRGVIAQERGFSERYVGNRARDTNGNGSVSGGGERRNIPGSKDHGRVAKTAGQERGKALRRNDHHDRDHRIDLAVLVLALSELLTGPCEKRLARERQEKRERQRELAKQRSKSLGFSLDISF